MSALTTIQTSGPDGKIHLEIPVSKAGEAYRVVVNVEEEAKACENGWPAGYFQATAGAWQGEFKFSRSSPCHLHHRSLSNFGC